MTTTSAPTQATPQPSRRILTVSLAIIAALIVAFFAFSSLFTEYLWFEQLGYESVLTTRWFATATMFVIGFFGMAIPLFIAIQLAYRLRPVYARLSSQLDRYQEVIEPLRRLAMWGMPLLFGLFAGFGAAGNWETTWRWFHGVSTTEVDPQFGLDTGFYLFALPFYSSLLSFISAVLVLCLLVTAFVSYVYGAVRVGQRELRISKAARIQLAVLAGLFLLVRAARFWLDRHQTLVTPEDRITGAAYTSVNAVIPGLTILSVVAIGVALLFFVTAVIGRWRLPLVGTAVLIVGAIIVNAAYPWAVNTFTVGPNQNSVQAEFYERNIESTKKAYGVDGMVKTPYEAETEAEAGQLRGDAETTASIRIIDPAIIPPTVRQLEQYRAYYQFNQNMDVDRYEIDGEMQDTVVAVRELDMNRLGDGDNWNNRTAVYTHGYGMVVAAGNQRTSDGEPVFLERGIPTSGFLTQSEEGFEPRIYFGEYSPTYSIVGAPADAAPQEIDFPRGQDGANETKTTFAGDGGPKIGSTFRKLLYALKFQSEQILFSDLVNEESQILYDRHPLVRVQKVAPYLELDRDPYPSVVDDRIVWIVDGYTLASTYPYSTSVSLSEALSDSNVPQPSFTIDDINYIRNSVKATVDAYDGSVTLYAWDEEDPVLQTWQKVYPATVKPMSEMSADLMSHVRYPTDLFKVQRNILGVYHIDDARSFAQQDNRWQTPIDPRSEQSLQPPYYLSMKMPGQDHPRFSMFSTFIPAAQGAQSRDVLMGYLAVDSDAGSTQGEKAPGYGQLHMLEIDADITVPGPRQVQSNFQSDTTIAQQLNVLTIGQSEVLPGNLLTLPLGGGLVYVQPVYVQSSDSTKLPRLRKVLVAFGDQLAFEDTLTEALDALFGGESGATGGDVDVEPTDPQEPEPTEPTEPEGPGTGTPQPPADSAEALLQQAGQAMKDRDAALRSGDLGAFAEADKRLTDALEKLLALSGEG